MVIDAFLYNGEEELLELRLKLLDEYVDQFVIVEADTTFVGTPKKLYFNSEKFTNPKIKYYVVNEFLKDQELWQQAQQSPNTQGIDQWVREFYQRESIKKALEHLKDNDLVYISDCDEIWKPQKIKKGVFKLNQLMYSYYLNNRTEEKWNKAFVGRWKEIKEESLNHLRSNPGQELIDGGWHWTNYGDEAFIRRKLESYGHQEFNTSEIKDRLAERIKKREDFIGRPTKMWRDESDLPKYVLDNREQFRFINPLVSIIIPMYNYGHYLHETIQSALNQTYRNFEIICVDDCSTDNSVEVASKFPVRIIRHEVNKGLAETRNTGIRVAKGELILPLDSDDWIHKDFLRYTLAENADIVSTGQRQFGDQNNVYIPQPNPKFTDFKLGNQINCCSLYKKEVWETVKGYESNKVFEDWQFWLKATHAGFTVKVVQYPLFFYRIHQGSMLDQIGGEHKEIGKKIIKDLGYE